MSRSKKLIGVRYAFLFIALATASMAFCTSASAEEVDDDRVTKHAESVGLEVRQVSETESQDANYEYYRSVHDGSLDGTSWFRATWDEKESKATGETTYTIKFVGKTFTTTDEKTAQDWLINEIDNLVNGVIASGAKENASPQAPQAVVADTIITNVMLPKIMPRVQLPVKQGGPAVKEKQNQGPGPVATHSTTWAMDTDSALRYERTWWDDEYYSNRYGATLRAAWQWERLSLDVALPIDRVTYQEPRDTFDYTRLGLAVTPRYNVVSQDVNAPVDLDIGMSLFYMYSFMDEDVDEEPNTIGFGPTAAVRKDFEYCSVGAGAMWMRGYDGNGNETGPGFKTYTDTVHAGLHVGVPVGDRWAINSRAVYNRILRIEDGDDDYVTMGLGAVYFMSDKWTFDVEARTNLGYEYADNISVHFGASWNF